MNLSNVKFREATVDSKQWLTCTLKNDALYSNVLFKSHTSIPTQSCEVFVAALDYILSDSTSIQMHLWSLFNSSTICTQGTVDVMIKNQCPTRNMQNFNRRADFKNREVRNGMWMHVKALNRRWWLHLSFSTAVWKCFCALWLYYWQYVVKQTETGWEG